MNVEIWELLSYIVTVVGLPLAIVVFALEQRKERLNEHDAVYESISEKYQEFLRVVLEHTDLRLFSTGKALERTEEQTERMMIIFSMLIALFECAYVLMYEDGLKADRLRLWNSWEDYMHEWCARQEFRDTFDTLLLGEDPDFVKYIRALAANYEAKL